MQKISIEDFQKVWNGSNGAEDMSQKTGLKIATIYARCVRYRKAGIHLKRFRLPAALQIHSTTGYEAVEGDNGQP
jgi:hypothetical protein